MNTRSFLQIAVCAVALATAHMASAQVISTSGETQANERGVTMAMTEGVMKVNGVLYVVTAGIAHRIDLADGQMATLDGLVRPIPANATLPGGVPQATISGSATAPSTATGAVGTPQRERNRNVGDPTPGSTTPSTK